MHLSVIGYHVRGAFTTLDDTRDSVVGFDLLTEYRNVRVRKERGVEGIRAFPRCVSGVSRVTKKLHVDRLQG